MAEKRFNARIIHKHETEANWLLATNFIPMQGEIIVYDIDDNYDYERIKIGDGVQNVNDLPFAIPDAVKTMVINVSKNSDDAYVADKTFAEVYGYLSNGGHVIAYLSETVFQCTYVAEDWIQFDSRSSINTDQFVEYSLVMTNSSDVLEYLTHKTTATQEYVDAAILAIPTPDVSGQIETHNTSETAHSDIRVAINDVSTLVGDTSVAEQIESAQIVYVGPTQPTDPNIKVWINTSEEGTGIVPVLPRIATINLGASAWTGNSAPYSQVVEINTVTSASKIDLQPTVSQIVSLQNDDIALMAENVDGVVTIYSFGGKPSSDMTMQVLLTEVSYV